MANSAGITGVAKQVALASLVDGKTLRSAIYLASANIAPATKSTYGGTVGSVADTGEVTGTNYTAGGVAVTNANTAGVTTGTAYWSPSANIVYSTVTLSTSFDCIGLFSTTDSNRMIALFTFTGQTITAGTLTLTVPTHDSTNGLLRIA